MTHEIAMKTPSLLSCALAISITVAGCCLPSSAQNPSYHVELSDGTSGRVILLNDSAKPIEAFFIWQQCGTAIGMSIHDTQRPSGSGFSAHIQDALSGPGDRIGIPGSRERMAVVVAPGGRFISSMSIASDPRSMKCEVKIIAGVFTDGSTEGVVQALSSMQASRDGIASGVRHWNATLNPASGEMPDPEAILSDAESRSLTDQQKLQISHGPVLRILLTPAYNYWTGRSQVDNWIANSMKDELPRHDPADALKSLARMIGYWQKKMDTDVAMKKLALAFPLPDGIDESDQPPAP